MLTIRAMSNGSGYLKEHLEHNDYFSEGEKVVGRWFGKGAEMLGLKNEVAFEDFEAVREALHPETGEMVRPRTSADRIAADGSKQSVGRNLYDFTFSAPKSVSILATIGGNGLVADAHNEAVQEALRELERCAATRVRTAGQNNDRSTGNLVVACYRHTSSRRLDMQLHHHCVAANLTYDPVEQRWKALQASGIYQRRAYLSEVYRNSLAKKLQKLGFEIEDRPLVRGRDVGFEVKGVSVELIEEFSKGSKERDEAVKRFTEKMGRTPTDNEVAILVRESRPGKLISISTEQVWKSWFGRVRNDEVMRLWDVSVDAMERAGNDKSLDAEASLQHAIDHVFERVSVACDFEILTEALRHGRGGIELDDLKLHLHQMEAKGRVLRSGDQIATQESLHREKEMIGMVNDGHGRFHRLGGPSEDFQISEKLNPEQRHVIEFVLNSRDRAVNIEGAAGTGKTATLSELRRALANRGVLAAAPTQSAVKELQKAGFENAMTVERLLQDQSIHPHLQGCPLIVDEASMVSGRQMHELLRLAVAHDARLVLCGDIQQIQSVEASDALRILLKESRLASVGLYRVQRQQEKNYLAAIKALRADPARGFQMLDRMGAVIESGLLDRSDAVALAFRAASGSKLCVCAIHEEIRRVTDAIRSYRLESGELTGNEPFQRLEPLNWTEAQKRDLSNFKPGHVLVFHRDTAQAHKYESFTILRQEGKVLVARDDHGKEIRLTQKQVKSFAVFTPQEIEIAIGDQLAIEANFRTGVSRFINGELVTVSRRDAEGNLKLDDGRILPAGFRQLNHGYAVTAHKSQGKTVSHVIVSGDVMSQELFYVAASRGRHCIQVFTGDKELLRQSIEASGQRMSALELLRKSARTVDRSRFAERQTTIMERLGASVERAWRSIPRLVFGERYASRQFQDVEFER